MSDQTEIVVVGSFVQDLAFRTTLFPRPGETRIGTFRTGPGGKGFNQAIAAHRQGITTKFIGAVGEDIFGSGIRDYAKQQGLEAAFQTIAGESTGGASIVVNERAENLIVVGLGASNFLDAAYVEREFPKSPKVVLIQVESNLDAAKRALVLGRSRGAINILNPAPINVGLSKDLLALADIITPNETEFLFLLKHLFEIELDDNFWKLPDAELHKYCRLAGVKTVILTLGEQGCFVSLPDRAFRVSAIKVNPIDTTGAGDALSGGLAAGIVRYPADLKRAVEFATVVAGLSTEKEGTAPAMPHKGEVERRLEVRSPQ